MHACKPELVLVEQNVIDGIKKSQMKAAKEKLF